jgi:hypothetical protein
MKQNCNFAKNFCTCAKFLHMCEISAHVQIFAHVQKFCTCAEILHMCRNFALVRKTFRNLKSQNPAKTIERCWTMSHKYTTPSEHLKKTQHAWHTQHRREKNLIIQLLHSPIIHSFSQAEDEWPTRRHTSTAAKIPYYISYRKIQHHRLPL